LKIYLDLCCFNRPYDDQSQLRIRIETEAKIAIQQKIKDAECELLWSSILDFECSKNPFEEHRVAILNWRDLACDFIFHPKVKTTGFSRLALAAIMRFLNGGEHGLQARKPYGFSN